MNVAVIGSGSWGCALAMVLHEAGHSVRLWAREQSVAREINENHTNRLYLPDISLSAEIEAFTELEECLYNQDMIVFATPSHAIRDVATRIRELLSGEEVLVSVAKGIENETFLTMSQVLGEVLDDCINTDHIGVLYGPSHAEEVSRKKPTAIVAAANSKGTAQLIQQTFMTSRFRVYVNKDILGVEIAGSLKNILALAAGIADGGEWGDNAKAGLLTRGLTEMRRLGIYLGASQDTFSGLSGIGDIIVTCTSRHSRNLQVGYRIGQGETLEDITSGMHMVAEGVRTTKSVYGWAQQLGIDMPITDKVYRTLFEGLNPKDAVHQLMTREPKDEIIL